MRTIRENITNLPYSLHDMHVNCLSKDMNSLIFHFEDGYRSRENDYSYIDGKVHFHKVDWDFCFVYVLNFSKNEGKFTGKKYFLESFIQKNNTLDFEIVDETYGYNTSKFAGYLRKGTKMLECTIEIYHIGDMEYVTD